jgi:glycerol-3-phosphate acyltransferase PlsY
MDARCRAGCGARSSTVARSFGQRVRCRRATLTHPAPTLTLPRKRGREWEGARSPLSRGAGEGLFSAVGESPSPALREREGPGAKRQEGEGITFAAAILGYLLGSIPFGLLLTRLAGHGDIRQIGSGSIGATNVLRTGSQGLAALTLLLDLAKGAAAVVIAQRWGHTTALAAAGCVILGHMFPVWLGFRGGKGVATALGVLIPLAWPVALVTALLWVVTALWFHFSSLAALVAAVAGAALAAVIVDKATALLIAGIALLIIARHHANIRRLLAGTESRISLGKS